MDLEDKVVLIICLCVLVIAVGMFFVSKDFHDRIVTTLVETNKVVVAPRPTPDADLEKNQMLEEEIIERLNQGPNSSQAGFGQD